MYPLKGPSICALFLQKTPMAACMSAARRLLGTMAGLNKAGIMHRAKSTFFHYVLQCTKRNAIDLNVRNYMWGMILIGRPSRSAKYELLGRPLKQKMPFFNLWKRGDLGSSVEVSNNQCTEEFYHCDLALAQQVEDRTTQHDCIIALRIDFMGKREALLAIYGAT